MGSTPGEHKKHIILRSPPPSAPPLLRGGSIIITCKPHITKGRKMNVSNVNAPLIKGGLGGSWDVRISSLRNSFFTGYKKGDQLLMIT